jgi:YfiH family protein
MSDDDGGPLAFTTLPGGWEVGLFGALEALPGVVHAVTTRRGLDAAVARSDPASAARRLAECLGLDGVAFSRQVHAAGVRRVRSAGPAGEADGLVTDTPRLGVMGLSADCPLILAADSAGTAVAVAHASWRGTLQSIAARLIETLTGELGAVPAELIACISPAAGPCCYEVGPEVRRAAVQALGPDARRFFRPGRADRLLFDLWSANRHQLLGAGLAACNVHTAGICTICRNDLFPSYRVEGDAAGRFAAVIGRTRQV